MKNYTEYLKKQANLIRIDILNMLYQAGSGHSASALGLSDLYAAAYFGFLNYDPKNPHWSGRDPLIISNGHTTPVAYATLARAGYFDLEELKTLRQFGSRLQGHPERNKLPGIETTSGPLGCGLSQAVGMAYSYKYLDHKKNQRIYVICGDGEINEGNIWEAAMFAANYHLDNLILFVDRNQIQIDGFTENVMALGDVSQKFAAFGWNIQIIDGNDIDQILAAVDKAKNHRGEPNLILLNTVPGKGVDFMENDFAWHGKTPNQQELDRALKQLENLV